MRTGTATVFSWTDGDNFTPHVPPFDNRNSGIQDSFPVVDDDAEELEYFEAFFDNEVMDLICEQTNLFHETTAQADNPDDPDDPDTSSSRSKRRKWTNVTKEEFFVFLALMMLMTHVKKAVLQDYWIVEDITSTPIFGKYMSRDRFIDILRFTHFVDNATERERKKDRLWKIRDLFTLLKDRFTSLFFFLSRKL